MSSSLYGGRGPSASELQGSSTGLSPMKNKTPSGYSLGRMQQFTPEQMQLFQQMFSQVSPDSYLSKLAGGDQETFNQMEEPSLRQFSELQGNIASRFSGPGGGGNQLALGGRRSSGFQNTMSAASSDFASQLQSQRQNLQRQALQDLMGLSSNLLGQRPFDNFLVKKDRKPSFLQSLFGGAAPIAGAVGGGMLGGPMGSVAGYQAGQSFGQAFQ